jgi:hypothetical protein
LLLLHVPPVVASASVVVDVRQTMVVPVIATGFGLMVTVLLPEDEQVPFDADTEYVIGVMVVMPVGCI